MFLFYLLCLFLCIRLLSLFSWFLDSVSFTSYVCYGADNWSLMCAVLLCFSYVLWWSFMCICCFLFTDPVWVILDSARYFQEGLCTLHGCFFQGAVWIFVVLSQRLHRDERDLERPSTEAVAGSAVGDDYRAMKLKLHKVCSNTCLHFKNFCSQSVLETGMWKPQSTFAALYFSYVIHKSMDSSFGPMVAAEQVLLLTWDTSSHSHRSIFSVYGDHSGLIWKHPCSSFIFLEPEWWLEGLGWCFKPHEGEILVFDWRSPIILLSALFIM